MIYIEFLIWHPPPGEVQLLPWGDVLCAGVESVVAFGAEEILLNILTVVEVGEATSEKGEECASLFHKVAILIAHTLN